MTIINDNAGFIFAGYDSKNFLMWQFSTHEFPGEFYLRPHMWNYGETHHIADVKIPESVVKPNEALNKKHHVTIKVDNKDTITTYINGQQIDQRKHGAAKFGMIGFRQFKDAAMDEQAKFDNIIIKSGKGKVIFSEDFSSGSNEHFDAGTVQSGELFVSDALTMQTDLEHHSAPMYRKEFNAEKPVKQARLYASALGFYEFEINGQKVGNDYFNPGWTAYELNQDDNNYVMYQTFDVTEMISEGENAIGATTGHGWYSGKLFVTGGNRYVTGSKLLAQLEITYEGGQKDIISTDSSWLSTVDGPIVSDDTQDGESYDARKEKQGWSSAGYKPDSTWIASSESLYNGDIIAQVGPTVKAIKEFEPIEITTPSEGTYIIDIGQNISGFARLNKVAGAAGTTVKIRYGEMLKNDGTLYTENLRTAKATDYYTLKGDPSGETWSPRFTFHGFRYVEVTNYPGDLTKDGITCVALSSLQETTGSFETSNELVNRLQSNITWGQRDNFISVPTDCPQRDERLGYTGDGQIFIRTAALNMNVNKFFEKYMADVSSNQRSDGGIADWAPNFVHNDSYWSWSGTFGTSGWGDAVVIIPWTVYMAYGNTDIIKDNYEAMKKWVGRYQNMGGSRLIVDSCTYGDWLSVNANTPTDVISTGYFAYCADLLSKMAEAIGETEDAQTYRQLFLDVREAFNREFVDPNYYIKGRTQTSYLLALKFDLLETQQAREKVAKHLVDDIIAKDWHLSTGFIGVSYLCPMLSEMGYSDVAYKLLLQEGYPSWLYSVKNGATTIWERWNSYIAETGSFGDVGMNSFNHYSLGSIGEWFYNYVAGINYDESNPGYKHFTITPQIGELEYVNCSFESVYGSIISNWKYSDTDRTVTMETSVPANTSATITVPTDNLDSLTVNGMPYSQTDSLELIEYKDNNAVFEAGSGNYDFVSEYAKEIAVNISAKDGNAAAAVSVNGGEPEILPTAVYCKPGSEITIKPHLYNTTDFTFVGWSGDAVSENEEIVITPASEMNIYLDTDKSDDVNLAIGKSASANSNINNAESGWNIDNLTDGILTSSNQCSCTVRKQATENKR